MKVGICTHVSFTKIYKRESVYVCMYIYMYAHMCMYIYTHAYMRTMYIHRYITDLVKVVWKRVFILCIYI